MTTSECKLTNECNFATPLNTPGMGMAAGVDPLVTPKKKKKKSLKEYIKELTEERKQISNQNMKRNTPDYVHYRGSHNYWTDKSARGFILNKDTSQAVFTEPGKPHEDIFDFPEFLLDMIGINGLSIEQLKFTEWEEYTKKELSEALKKWYDENKEYVDKFLLGRIWYVEPNSKSSDDELSELLFGTQSDRKKSKTKPKTFISWWSELTSEEFNEYNQSVIEQFNENYKTNITTYYAVDNNGHIIKVTDGKKVDIKARSEEVKKEVETIEAIHNGTQEAKRKFFANYRDIKNAKFAEKWLSYKDNKSGTEAEYRWRHTIGDSLEDFCNSVIVESDDFMNKHGIKTVESGLGWSEKEQKWYGWSHRAIYGYGVGQKIKKGACGYEEMMKACPSGEIKTLDDAKKIAKIFSKAVS